MNCDINKRNFKTSISNIKLLAEDVMEITLKLEDGVMCYKPGQYVLMKISKSPILMRAYSILDYNQETNELKLSIKKAENGKGTKIIFDTFEVGMSVDIMGAMGDTLVVDKNKKDIMLVASGVGIVPIMCMLEDLDKSKYDGKISVLYGARTLKDMHYMDKIEVIAQKNSNIEFLPVLSREESPNTFKGYITDRIKSLDLKDTHIYMCSSKKVATSFKETLEEIRFDLKKFSCECA